MNTAEAQAPIENTQTLEMLRVQDLHAYYGESHILHGVNFDVKRGELVTLLGRNGAGRSTTLKSIMNMVGRRTGSIVINGNETLQMKPHHIPRLGIGYCPEERGIFPVLMYTKIFYCRPRFARGMSLDEIYAMFPNLYERRKARVHGFPVANSRCWPWRAFCAPVHACCCWMKSPRGWPRSLFRS
ncbi:hypothetical protein HSBAA_26490 [Vreelandella sulfidaeris]|uniref:ABC transporter domain-containing protein n=1 Tax=Vreelandella sulfidaeris TaxID=115553 RepID=A0A455U815_9GAMM|nr:hypothetical protein HSBAA_26490 [Halomonas sulfidaeris]